MHNGLQKSDNAVQINKFKYIIIFKIKPGDEEKSL